MTIDWWTLGIQSVNIVILIWLLGHFFWRPVAAMIEQRRAATREAIAQVEVQRTQASAALADIERTRAGFAGEREALLAAARQAAEQERDAILARISQQTKCIGAANQRKILWRQSLTRTAGIPRCRQRVARRCLNLHPSKTGRWWLISAAER